MVMTTLIWVTMCFGLALLVAIIAMGAIDYYVFGDSKEEVIANIKLFITGEEP